MTEPTPDAFFFDMDGTLINTEPYWAQSQRRLLASQSIPWRAELDTIFTGQSAATMVQIMHSEGLDMPGDEIVRIVCAEVFERLEAEIPWRPGARDFLESVRQAGYKTAMVTMSQTAMAKFVADHMGFDAFDTVISGDQVTNGKPDPEPYLLAATRLDSRPAQSMAFEDSKPGLHSAIAAGMNTVFVPCDVEIPVTEEFSRWDTLSGKTVADALAHYQEITADD